MPTTIADTPAARPSLRSTLGRFGDLVLVGLSVLVIALMVLPIPPQLLDVLIAANLSFAIGLLLYSIYMNSPVAFSTFPSLLLITTLLRIAINVATTRQILLHASGGDIIATFGKLVVGGSLAVGLVVFIIITVVQFIVIAKGAERVAEVIARFTLDAIPGKQMSIDSDLRAGLITEDEARRRRRDLENESRFFGAMDGAMKFVKGDAIAGIVIILVNLLGGLAIGIVVHGMSASVAVSKYSVLSIGEGLAAQIPALFIALSAGIIVTRSSSGDERPLASSISRQIVSQPRALVMTGSVVLLFSLVPGFPRLTFFLFGLGLLAAGATVLARARRRVDGQGPGLASMVREGSKELHPVIDESVPPAFATLAIDIAPSAVAQLSREALDAALLRLRRALSEGPGLPFPGLRIRPNAKLDEGHFVISVLETPAARGSFRPDEVDPWGLADLLVTHLHAAVERQPHRLLGVQDTQALVQASAREYPDLVREAMKVVNLPRLTKLLKGLLAEGISLRHMRDILHAAQEHAGAERDDDAVIERIRSALRNPITERFAQSRGGFDVLLLEAETEALLRQSLAVTSAGLVVAVSPEQARSLIDQLKAVTQRQPVATRREHIPLLAAPDLRRPLRRLIEAELPWLAVISHDEIVSGTTLTPLAVVRAA